MAEGPLAGRVAIVTGAARGIGHGYALRLARLGAAVAIVDRNLRAQDDFPEEQALVHPDGTAADVEALGVQALALEADLTDPAAARDAVRAVVERFGRVDVCICNAGGGSGAMTENTASTIDPEQLQGVLDGNLMATVNTCTPVAEVMREQRAGKIVTVVSVSGIQPRRDGGYAHYAAAKAAVISYTRNLAQELGPFGVTANAIAPGAIATGRLLPKIRAEGLGDVEGSIALRRLGTVGDCAGAIEFLATDLSAYVTGHVLVVDGGLRS